MAAQGLPTHDPRQSSCVVCGSTRTGLSRADLADFEYSVQPELPLVAYRCEDCGSEYLHPRPTPEDLNHYYPSDYHAYNDDHGPVARALVRMRASRRAKHYSELLEGRRGRLFDVGAGDCRHFDELRKVLDIECAGVELNPEVAAAGRARGYAIADGTLEDLDMTGHAGQYDLVSMNHVLEHVIEPSLVIQRAFDLLRPGGHLLGQLPTNASWEAHLFGRTWGGYHYPRHLQMFSREGLARLLESTGFEDVGVRSALHVQTALSMQNRIVSWGWHPEMKFGKTPAYSALLVASAPFELAAYAADKGGIMDFTARRPL
ncbi:MAG: class I SAM-dependent methyltransferase [Acidimicrobiia bacterium]